MVVLLAAALDADTPAPQTALSLIDAYLATCTPSIPAYRTDAQNGGTPEWIPAGRLFAIGPMIGPFTYRPKTHEELTKDKRASLLADPRFRALLIASRIQEDRQDGRRATARSTPRGAVQCFAISPEKMLQDWPILIVLGNP